MYDLLFRLLLRHIPPERAHALAKRCLRLVRATAGGRAIVRRLVGPTPDCLETHAFGRTVSSPLGAAAGLDKDASWFEDLGALGFGFVEVGTLTALPQAGNPPPRVQRLVADRALLNKMGFPNPGAAVAARTLAHVSTGSLVGVNVGKSMAVPVENAESDYRAAVRHLAPVAGYLVLNVSSPNTPRLREMQTVERLRILVAAVRSELSAIGSARPLLIKVGADLADEQLDAITALALELDLDGIVAVNTSVDRSLVTDPGAGRASFPGGGISGAPLRPRAVEVLHRIRRITHDKLVLISVGGVESADDVWERILAGATLVQAYTAFVYAGPGWPSRINRELAARVREAGVASIQDLVGTGEGNAAPRRSASARPALS